MKRQALTDLCGSNGIDVVDGWNRPDMIQALIDRRNQGNALVQPAVPGDRKLFDELTEPVDSEGPDLMGNAEPAAEPKKQVGGYRPGAGRKPGVTQEQSRIDNLPTTANRTVLYLVRAISMIMVRLYRCDELAMGDDECDRVAVAVTRSMEFHGFAVPQGAAVDIECAGVLFEVGAPRAIMISQIVKAKKNGQPTETNNDYRQDGIGQDGACPQPDPAIVSMPGV